MVARNNLVGCRLTTNSVGSLNWGKSHGLILKQWFTIEGFQVQTRLVWLEWHVFQGSSGCSGLCRWEWDKDGHKEAASEAFTTWGMVRAQSGRWERAWKQGKWFFSRKNQGNLVMDWELGVSKRETLWSRNLNHCYFCKVILDTVISVEVVQILCKPILLEIVGCFFFFNLFFFMAI